MKKVLVIVDMQNDFVDGVLGTKEAKAIVENVVNKINTFDGDMIVTYDTHAENYMETREGKYLPVKHCVKDTYGWELNGDIQKALQNKDYTILHKPTFGSTKLVDMFWNCKEEETDVTFVGLCTDICVVSNAMLLKAYYPEMNISVDAKCCAGVTPESHDAALLTMKMCQINII